MSKICSVCLGQITNEEAPVLTMGAYGTPRLLCDGCAADIEAMTHGREYGEVIAAMDSISDKMSRANIDDRIITSTVTDLLVTSAKRANEIKEGTYDFSLDDVEDEDYEIPEDMRETEEDRALDEAERKQNEKFDKVMNFVWIGVIAVAVAFAVWWIFF